PAPTHLSLPYTTLFRSSNTLIVTIASNVSFLKGKLFTSAWWNLISVFLVERSANCIISSEISIPVTWYPFSYNFFELYPLLHPTSSITEPFGTCFSINGIISFLLPRSHIFSLRLSQSVAL